MKRRIKAELISPAPKAKANAVRLDIRAEGFNGLACAIERSAGRSDHVCEHLENLPEAWTGDFLELI